MTDWNETPEALRFLAELDAAERSSDTYSGRGWAGVADACATQAADAEAELEQLRHDAVEAIADATGATRDSDEWLDAWTEADDDLLPVKDAIQQARRNHAGDSFFEQADAA